MKIRTAAILGAGAIGCYFIAGLSERLGDNLWVIAEGERAARLSRDGLLINGVRYDVNVKTAGESVGVDLLVIAVKYAALEGILPAVKEITTEQTIVLSPLNGVDSEDVIGAVIGEEHMLRSIMKVSSQRRGNEITYNPASLGVFFGETDGKPSERTDAVAELLEGTLTHYQVRANITEDIWYKYALNISRNLPQAIIGCGAGAYEDSEHMEYISARMRAEVVAVAAAKGIDISDETNPIGKPQKVAPTARFSTLQDIDAKRETEIEMFSGTLIRMGRELGVETPFNEFAYHAIRALEEKNRGDIR